MTRVEDLDRRNKNRQEACKTFVEQTKLLVTLASAFIAAPAAAQIILGLTINKIIVVAELLFIVSVLAGYVALAAITGTQHKGDFNVHRAAARRAGKAQFFSYLIGLLLFMYWFVNQPPKIVTAPTSNSAQIMGQPNPNTAQNNQTTRPCESTKGKTEESNKQKANMRRKPCSWSRSKKKKSNHE